MLRRNETVKYREVYDEGFYRNKVSEARDNQREGFLLRARSFFCVTNEMTIIRIAVAERIFKGTRRAVPRVFLWKLKSRGGE